MMDINAHLGQWFAIFFDKKSSGRGGNSGIMSNKELQKLIIGKFEKREVYSLFKDSIWGADVADLQLLFCV